MVCRNSSDTKLLQLLMFKVVIVKCLHGIVKHVLLSPSNQEAVEAEGILQWKLRKTFEEESECCC